MKDRDNSGGDDQVRFTRQGKRRLVGAAAAFNKTPSDMPNSLFVKRVAAVTAAFNHAPSDICRICY